MNLIFDHKHYVPLLRWKRAEERECSIKLLLVHLVSARRNPELPSPPL